MALNAYGFGKTYAPSIGAQFHEANTLTYRGQRVDSGLDVTAGPGSALTVSAGRAVLPGLFVTHTSAASVPIEAGHRGKRCTVVIDADWTASAGAGAIKLALAQGGSAYPTLIQQAGTRWQMPLARVIVSSTGAVTNLVPCKPISARAYPFLGTGPGADQVSPGVTRELRRVPVPDPGFPYWLDIKGDCRARAASPGGIGGYAELAIRFQGDPIAGTPGHLWNEVVWEALHVSGQVRTPQTGVSTVTLMGSVRTGGGLTDLIEGALYVTQHPAF